MTSGLPVFWTSRASWRKSTGWGKLWSLSAALASNASCPTTMLANTRFMQISRDALTTGDPFSDARRCLMFIAFEPCAMRKQ